MKSFFVSLNKGTTIILAALAGAAIFWFGSQIRAGKIGESVSSERENGSLSKGEAFFRYSPPLKLARLANEWEPQEALLLSISFPESMGNYDIARYQIQLLEVAHQYMDIYVFCEEEEERAFAFFLSLLKQHPQADSILAKTHFIDSRPLLRWIRDYGPIWGFNRDNELVGIDFVYRQPLKELEVETLKGDDAYRDFLALQGDAMPADVVSTLQSEYDTPIRIVRPPLSMDGGDFVSDGRGNAFVSTNTLTRNGGNKEEVQKLFQQYFGIKKLHVLNALPGATVRHLDMIFKFVDYETVLLPEYHEYSGDLINPYRIELSRKIRKTIEKNELYLRKHFPNYRILKVPMPPLLLSPRNDVITEAKQEFIKVVALERELLSRDKIENLTSADLVELEKQVIALIQRETPNANFKTPEGFNAILRDYGQMPLETIVDLHAEPVTRYRSYINSLFVNSKEGKQAFILPRFSSTDTAEAARLKAWEATTEKVYREAWPNAAIHWINCDSMVSDMGFVHCSTLTVPSAPFN